MPSASARPRAVTLAASYVVLGSVLILIEAAGLITAWGSIEVQERLDVLLPDDLETSTVMNLRHLLYVPLLLSVATGVLGVFVALRRRSVRLPLTVLTGLGLLVLPLTMPVAWLTALVVSAVMFGCALSLWSGPSARWLDGLPAHDPTTTPTAPAEPAGGEAAATAPAGVAAPVRTQRPRAVDVAAWTAIASAAAVAAFGLLTLLMLTVASDAIRADLETNGMLRDLLRDSGMSVDGIVDLMRVSSVVWLALAVPALVAAILTLRGSGTAAKLLLGLSVVTIAVSIFFLPLGLLTGAAAVVTLLNLRRAEARSWLSAGS